MKCESLHVKVGVFWVFYRRGCFLRGIISLLFTHFKVVYRCVDDHACELTLFG